MDAKEGGGAAAAEASQTARKGRPEEWRAALLRARKRLGVSRARLAALAGVSPATVRGYELGRRHPKHASLEAIIAALKLERVEANAVREGAGFAQARPSFLDAPDYYFGVEELREYVERAPWPEFVVNDSFEFIAANRIAGAVWGIDFEAERARRAPLEMNLLAVADEFDFPRLVENWDEILELIASMYKGHPVGPEDLAAPGPYLARAVQHFNDNDPGFLARLLDAWNRAEPLPTRVRESYRIIWNHERYGRMCFYCLATTANERDGLVFNDWIPVDAETWHALDALQRAIGLDPDASRAYLMRPRARLEP